MMDIHPLQTPNTALTDCLNGTFITYNGNEYVLQNDMGNFKLDKCKLKENYIPIGTASYGDILYIASYNPIDKKFELGSYPSPMQWNSSTRGTEEPLVIPSIIEAAIENGGSLIKYSDVRNASKSIIFGDFKLNPGDEYQIEITGEPADIETVDYFILDENNNKHTVNVKTGSEFNNVSWGIPGYLGAETRVLAPYNHTLKLQQAITGPSSVTLKVQSIIDIDDPILCDKRQNFIDNLKVEVSVSTDTELRTYTSSDAQYLYTISDETWMNNKRRLYLTYDVSIELNLVDKNEVPIDLSATLIYCGNVNGKNYELEYDEKYIASVSYVANGTNIEHIAGNKFYWTNMSNGTYHIFFDSFVDGPKNIEYHIKHVDQLSKVKLSEITWTSYDPELKHIEVNNVVDGLYLITFRFEGKNDQWFSRFAYLGSDFVCPSYGRADILSNLTEVALNGANDNIHTYSFYGFEPTSNNKFLSNWFKHYKKDSTSDLNRIAALSNTNETKIGHQVRWVGKKSKISLSKISSTFWGRFDVSRKYSYDKNTYYDWNNLPLPAFTSEIDINNEETWYKPIESVFKFNNDSSKSKELWWSHYYKSSPSVPACAACFRSDKTSKADDGSLAENNPTLLENGSWKHYYKDSKYEPNDSFLNKVKDAYLNYLTYDNPDTINFMKVGVVKHATSGPRLHICEGESTKSIWMVSNKEDKGSWHIPLKYNGELILLKPTSDDSWGNDEYVRKQWVENLCSIKLLENIPNPYWNPKYGWKTLEMYYGNSIHYRDFSPNLHLYEQMNLIADKGVAKWMLTKSGDTEILGIYKRWIDENSKIQYIDSTLIKTEDLSVNIELPEVEDYVFDVPEEYTYLYNQFKTASNYSETCDCLFLGVNDEGNVLPQLTKFPIHYALSFKIRDDGKYDLVFTNKQLRIDSGKYVFRTQKASGINKEWRVLVGYIDYYKLRKQ